MRRISDLARMGILGGFFGTVISIVLVYFLRERGVVPALVGIAVAGLITSWWYSRKVEIEPPSMTLSVVRQEASGLLKLGFAFMVSGFLMMGAAYAVRTMVIRMVGLEAAGFILPLGLWAVCRLYSPGNGAISPRLTVVARTTPM
jgi:PST family polysaccharide transporter